ncbi:hypothetical protein Tsp_08285 [Trichinella spiralis]|uniref:hypothetical protein n=1 Tax=Trichinella spiralis TaxID=6334 RepID=UPI0001EFCD15|nr:hypothetical protein Tsp_08285 [Trichinella spiralis]
MKTMDVVANKIFSFVNFSISNTFASFLQTENKADVSFRRRVVNGSLSEYGFQLASNSPAATATAAAAAAALAAVLPTRKSPEDWKKDSKANTVKNRINTNKLSHRTVFYN